MLCRSQSGSVSSTETSRMSGEEEGRTRRAVTVARTGVESGNRSVRAVVFADRVVPTGRGVDYGRSMIDDGCRARVGGDKDDLCERRRTSILRRKEKTKRDAPAQLETVSPSPVAST